LNTGIKTPAGYSEAAIEEILNEDGDNSSSDSKVNIIFVQLESFVDPSLFTNITLSEVPTPNFEMLRERFSSGLLTVPVVGAGTANTEFEAITGMSAKFFGPGEYPYESILTKETCESIPYNLKQLGYSTHAIHNHRAVFYGRNTVFTKLGFDTFTSLEYMIGPVKTPRNWAKDGLLTGEIMSALNSTPGQDYIYTISTQGHGKYPTEQILTNPEITVGGTESDSSKWAFEYYVNQIHEMDQFIKVLTDTLNKYDEKVVLVMYGDHLPALEFTASEISTHSLYKTQYVIWNNFGMKKIKEDMTSYQIGAEVLDRLNIHTGTITKFHQTQKGTGNYLNKLRLLQYDMLYGNKYVYGGKTPFLPVELRMGVNPITIDEIVELNGKYYLKGQNFTEYSKVSLNGKVLDTLYLSPTILGLIDKADPIDVPNMKVSQLDRKNKEILSTTE
jgi:phosphoglycerol transferase MdoB-like AlkP superfamily enzyme